MAAVVPPFYNFTGNYKPSGQDRTAAEGKGKHRLLLVSV